MMAMAAYSTMAIAAFVALVWQIRLAEMTVAATAPVGAVFTFIALLTGAIWGKPMWGAWWVWDARVTSMLVLFFLYVGVIALYEAFDNERAAARACAVLSLVGTVNIPIIYKSVDWWYSLHQPATIKFTEESSMHSDMLTPLLLMIVAFYCLFTCSLLLYMRAEILRREGTTSWVRKLLLGGLDTGDTGAARAV